MCSSADNLFCNSYKEGWKKVRGTKGAIWGAALLFTVICIGGSSLLGSIITIGGYLFIPHYSQIMHGHYDLIFLYFTPSGHPQFTLIAIAATYYLAVICFEMFALLPMRFGALLIPIRRAADRSVSPLFIFKFFAWRNIKRFIWLEVLLTTMVGVPGILAILSFCAYRVFAHSIAIKIIAISLAILLSLLTIYLMIGYLFASQLIIDRDISAWQALELSRKTVHKKWFCIFFTLLWLSLVMIAGIALFLVGLIWAIPYILNVISVLYRDMLGIEGKDPVTMCEKLHDKAKA